MNQRSQALSVPTHPLLCESEASGNPISGRDRHDLHLRTVQEQGEEWQSLGRLRPHGALDFPQNLTAQQ